jgi:tetratricopeptide (TPR) repeat protein
MKHLTIFILLVGLAMAAQAQSIVMKDGRRIVAKTLRRQGDAIMAGDPSENGGAALNGEVGYPLTQIEKLEFPEPAQLRLAADSITQGKATEAVSQLDQALHYYEGFRDAPGSYWADLALLKVNALLGLGRYAEAEPIASQVARLATDPETILGAKAQAAACLGKRGDHAKAVEMCDQVLKDASRSDILASAAIYKGQSHLALKQWEPALLAFLDVPVLHADQKALLPQALLGAGRALFALEDYPRAKASLNELISTYGASAEATAAKAELEKIARREKALESPK